MGMAASDNDRNDNRNESICSNLLICSAVKCMNKTSWFLTGIILRFLGFVVESTVSYGRVIIG